MLDDDNYGTWYLSLEVEVCDPKPTLHPNSTDYYDVVTNMSETEKENMDQEQEITPCEQTKINKYTDTEQMRR